MGPIFQFHLKNGDIVVMSRVANGKDWEDAPKKRGRCARPRAHRTHQDPSAGVHMRVN